MVSEELSSVETETFHLDWIFLSSVSEELSSVETRLLIYATLLVMIVSEELSSVETKMESKGYEMLDEFQKNLVVWKRISMNHPKFPYKVSEELSSVETCMNICSDMEDLSFRRT